MNGLTTRERRLVALGLLVAAIALIWFVAVAPILRGFAARQEARVAAQSQLEHNARLIASFGRLKAEVAAQRRTTSIYALSAASPFAASEAARDRVAKAAVASGGLVQGLRNQPAPAGQVRLQADVRIGLAGLTNLIGRLEDDRPYATVDGLFVTAADASGAAGSTPLEVRLEVSYGFSGAR